MTGFAVSLRPGLVESRLPTDYVSMAKVSRAVPACTTLSAADPDVCCTGDAHRYYAVPPGMRCDGRRLPTPDVWGLVHGGCPARGARWVAWKTS